MLITKENRYLVLPIKESAEETLVFFYKDGKLLYDIKVHIDFENPDYIMHYDMFCFLGQDIEIVYSGGELKTADKPAKNTVDKLRPVFHFALETGWCNDPNGLVFYEGKHHMFFQHNPAGAHRGSEHWGHAVSEDLINWEFLPDALYPDNTGTVFSGSAIIDEENILGLKTDEHTPLLLYYTASGGERQTAAKGVPFTQGMAYSTDGGLTFTKYEGNPIIDAIASRTRDPYISYDDESGMYIILVYIGDDADCAYGLFKSADLVNWTEISRQKFEKERQCPALHPMYDGDCKKWVFVGSTGGYVVADLDLEKGLINCSPVKQIGYGDMYAGQDYKYGDGYIRIAWDRLCRKRIVDWDRSPDKPTKAYSQIMSIPVKLRLENGEIKVKPFFEFAVSETAENCNYAELQAKPCLVNLAFAQMPENTTVELFGVHLQMKDGVIRFSNVMGESYEMPSGKDIKIFADNIGYDIFVGDTHYASFQAIADYTKPTLNINGEVPEKIEVGYFNV